MVAHNEQHKLATINLHGGSWVKWPLVYSELSGIELLGVYFFIQNLHEEQMFKTEIR